MKTEIKRTMKYYRLKVVQMYREKLELTLKILEEYHEDKKN